MRTGRPQIELPVNNIVLSYPLLEKELVGKVDVLFPIVIGNVMATGAVMKTYGRADRFVERRHLCVVNQGAPPDGVILFGQVPYPRRS